MMEWLNVLSQERAAIKAAPRHFAIACLAACVLIAIAIWCVMDWKYSSTIQSQDHELAHYRQAEQIAASKPPLVCPKVEPPACPKEDTSPTAENAPSKSMPKPKSGVRPQPDSSAASLRAPAVQTVNAPNGIGSIGGTLINPLVNNYGPPPAALTFTEHVLTPLGQDTPKVMEAHVSTDRSIPGAAIAIVFSAPITLTREFWDAHRPIVEGSTGGGMIDVKAPVSRGGVPIPNSVALYIQLPSAFVHGQTLVVTVESSQDVHVTEVMQIGP